MAIILSRTGDDGAEGCIALNEAGGKVLVQDPNTSAYPGMPNQTIQRDGPEAILSPAQLASQLNEYLTLRESPPSDQQRA